MKKSLLPLLFILSTLMSWAQYEPLTQVTLSPVVEYDGYMDMTFGYSMQFVEDDVAAREFLITITNESGSFTYLYGIATLTTLSGGKTQIRISSNFRDYPPGSADAPYDWPHGKRLKVNIPAGMFKNQNNVVWPDTDRSYITTAEDTRRPVVKNHNAKGFINDEEINYYYFEFSEPVIRGNGQIRFINEEDPSRSLVYSSFDPRVSIVPILNTPGSGLSKSTVAIRPDKLISDGDFLSDDYDRYRVQIDRDAFVDTRGAGLDVHYLSEQFTVNNNIAYDFEFAVGYPYENYPPQREVGTFSVKGVGYPQFSITNNPAYPDNNLFYVVGDKLKTKISFDYETKSSYTLEVAVAELVMEITIDVINHVDESPQLVSTAPVSSALPPQLPGNLVRRLKMEFHQPITVTNSSISIYKKPSNTLVQQINLSTDPNVSIYNENTLIVNIDPLEPSTSYYVYVPNNAITGYPGRIAETDWQFTTANVLSAPTGPTNISLSQNSVYENQPSYTNIGALTATDPTLQETFDYYFTDTGTKTSPDGKFTISQFQQDFGLNTGVLFDYEDQDSYNVDITVEDAGGLRYSKIFTINVLDGANEAPTNIQFSGQFATDGQPIGTTMGQFSTTDGMSDTHTYQLVAGEGDDDNAKFTISGNNLRSAMVFDYPTQNTFNIRVRSRDQGFLTVVRTFVVQIAPSDPNFSAITKLPQTITFPTMNNVTYSPAQTIPLAATASSGLTLFYSVTTGQAYVDGSTLHITGGGLVEIEAYQPGNATFSSASETASFTVNKANQTITFGALAPKIVGDAPYNVTATSTSGLSPKFQSSNTAVATVNASGLVTIVAPGTTTITASQNGNLEYNPATGVDQQLVVTNINNAPTDITLSTSSINENNAVNAVIGSFITTDPDAGNTFSYTFVAGAGSDDNGSFSMTTNNLRAPISFDFETKSSYSIRIRSTDQGGLFFEKQFTITIGDVVEGDVTPPTIVSFNPLDNATGVALNADLVVTFNEPILAGGAYVKVRNVGNANNILGGRPEFDTDQFSVLGNSLIIHLAHHNSADVPLANTEYYVEIQNGAVTDIAGNAFANGFADVTTWSFTTAPKQDQTITFAALPGKTFGDANFDLTASASSGLDVAFTSSNTSVATVSGNTVTIVGGGTTDIRANQAGNEGYNAALEVARTLTVSKANQTITFTPITNKATTDGSFAISATATSGLALTYAILSGPATVTGSTITLAGTTGTVEVQANQAGNDNYNVASEAITFEVIDNAKQTQTITFAALDEKSFGDAPFELSATASSGLNVNYSSSNSSVATINGNTVTIVGVGEAAIIATQDGNDVFNHAPTVVQSLTVNKGAQTITFTTIEDQILELGSVTLSATSSSGLDVSFTLVSGPATINGNLLNFEGMGEVRVSATQAGNTNYLAAESVEQTFDISTITGDHSIIEKPSVTLAPNPATDFLILSGLPEQEKSIGISSLNGMTVIRKEQVQEREVKIDISQLTTGLYITTIKTATGLQTIRFIKK